MTTPIFDRLSREQLEAILDALPLEFIFVDHEDRLQYYNNADKRSRQGREDILGQDIRDCHQPSSAARTDTMLNNFKEGKTDEDEFWIGGENSTLLNRFLAVRDKEGTYVGCLEYLLDFATMEELAKSKAGSYHFNPLPEDEANVKEEH